MCKIKRTILISGILLIAVIGCGQKQTKTMNSTQDIQDTVVIKQQNVLKPAEIGFYSKSYSYYWLAGKDTLDFNINVTEYEKDSLVNLNVSHNKKLVFFTIVLGKINKCLPLIKEDFDISKFNSICFNEPGQPHQKLIIFLR